MLESSSLLLPCVALPFLAAVVVGSGSGRIGRASGWIVFAAALASFLSLVPAAATHGIDRFSFPWLPAAGISFALRADGFGLLLAFIVSGIGALVALYSTAYVAEADPAKERRYYAALASFMGAMLGIALADDLILLFVFWEITSITSFLLIGYRYEDDDAKAGALMALQVTALGGLAMSVGFLLVAQVTGTFSISAITSDPALIAKLLASPLCPAALLLVLLGAFTKSAQFPFHFWLPRAMVAPTPVSAYLHAATMVKAGVFLLGRTYPMFGEAPLWAPTLVVVGTTSMLLGAYQAFREIDLKAILARTTASALGMITLLYGLGATTDDSLQILNHALYKGALFLVAGIVEHHAHTRRLDQLGGLRHALPIAFVACALGSLSMAGFPPLLGFVAKDNFYAALLHSEWLAGTPLLRTVVLLASLASSALLVATAGKLTFGVFSGAERAHAHGRRDEAHADEPRVPLWTAPAILAGGALLLGLASLGELTSDLVTATASAPEHRAHATLLPALGWPLFASLFALVLGVALYTRRDAVSALQKRLAGGPAASAMWEGAMAALARGGEAYSVRWQNGSLRWYLAATVLTLPALCVWAFSETGLSWRQISVTFADTPWYGFLFCTLLAVATIATVRARTRLAAAISTTTIGFLVAMLFVVYRSPDILLTQLLIETVSSIFVLLVLVFLPAFPARDMKPGTQLVNLGIAAAFGVTITILLLLTMTPGIREPSNIATRPGGLLSLALEQGGGKNAVNVIIVDIRAADTTGEITVLVVVGLAVYGLLRTRRRARQQRKGRGTRSEAA